MAKRRFVIMVGLPHAGGGDLSARLASARDVLAEHGVTVPARSAEESRHAGLEIRRLHAPHGLRRKDVEGSWARLCRRARTSGARSQDAVLVAEELLAGATPDQIDLLLDSLGSFEVHVVVLVADPAHQLAHAWAEALWHGCDLPFSRFARRCLGREPGSGASDGWALPWADQDLPAVLHRWADELRRADRVHVVVADAERPVVDAAWTVVARLVGVDPVAVPLPPVAAGGGVRPLDPAALDVLREVNESTSAAATVPDRSTLVGSLTDGPAGPADNGADSGADSEAVARLLARLSEGSREALAALGERWVDALAHGGYAVTGDAGALRVPADALSPADTAPTDPDLAHRLQLATDALADLVADTARLRQAVGDLEHRNARLTKKLAKKKRTLRELLATG
ncbi:hypothetical protein [Nocardioides sp. GY 10127]|uniref:hypothetical protein n=1 Tax=Nocardioides sp. GY 10127 TaxID=2569762 RepID=UPI0010A91266|nr:hypothetical protein [Nocardioides sp. GY 10127]TIC82931.1 hypothetical protein E8D37_09795 [Nocardioides sp. GY 10127]